MLTVLTSKRTSLLQNWIPVLVAPAALLLALVAARLHQLKSAAVPPSVTTSIAMPLHPRGPAPELRVVGVLGSLPGMATQAAAVDAQPLGEGARGLENDGLTAVKGQESQGRVDGRLARNDNSDPHIPRPQAPGKPQAPAKPITELSDIDFYDQLRKEAEIEARVRQAQGFPMKDETKFGVFDEEERNVMQELVDSGMLDADTQKKLEELLAQEAGNSKMRKAAQRALGKRVRKARAGSRSPVSDKDLKELEEAVASGMLDEQVQKDVEAFLAEEREFRKESEEDKYDDADYDISEYLEEEEDPELEAMIRQMVESGEFEMPADEDDDEENAVPFGQVGMEKLDGLRAWANCMIVWKAKGRFVGRGDLGAVEGRPFSEFLCTSRCFDHHLLSTVIGDYMNAIESITECFNRSESVVDLNLIGIF